MSGVLFRGVGYGVGGRGGGGGEGVLYVGVKMSGEM